MKFFTWLHLTGTTIVGFAEKIGVNKSLAHKYAKNNVIPRHKIMTKIFIETLGRVSANDFYDLSEKIFDEMVEDDKAVVEVGQA